MNQKIIFEKNVDYDLCISGVCMYFKFTKKWLFFRFVENNFHEADISLFHIIWFPHEIIVDIRDELKPNLVKLPDRFQNLGEIH